MGQIPYNFVLYMGRNSEDLFSISPDIEKVTGLSLEEARKSNETKHDAYVHGLVTVVNNGKEIIFFINTNRQKGRVDEVGAMKAWVELVAHESVHLARVIINRHMIKSDKWSEMDWNCVGEDCKIDEESFADTVGKLAEVVIRDAMSIQDGMDRDFKFRVKTK